MQSAMRVLVGLAVVVACTATCDADSNNKVLFVGKKPDHPFGTQMYLHS